MHYVISVKPEEIHDVGGEEKEVIHHLVKDYIFQEDKLLDPIMLDDEGEEEEVSYSFYI